VVPIAVSGTLAALPKGKALHACGRRSACVRPPVAVQPTGRPRARRTVRDAGEQLRLALLAHLQSTTEETR
jgi:hypothetical protein